MIPTFIAEIIVKKALVWLAGVLGKEVVTVVEKKVEGDWHYDPPPEHPIDPRNPYAEDRATQNQD